MDIIEEANCLLTIALKITNFKMSNFHLLRSFVVLQYIFHHHGVSVYYFQWVSDTYFFPLQQNNDPLKAVQNLILHKATSKDKENIQRAKQYQPFGKEVIETNPIKI